MAITLLNHLFEKMETYKVFIPFYEKIIFAKNFNEELITFMFFN